MAKIIMVQGTSSGVGKSIVTTALCRIFKENGYKVAPFKVQNLSTNYFEFENGDKIAKSQALQAYACGMEPTALMNPILLYPKKNSCDIIINGQFYKNIKKKMSIELKKEIFKLALQSFEKLNSQYDIIVIEGAGSPVELNLNDFDIVNMGFATKVNAPVLLVSDITRGGVFANLYGTMELLKEEKKRVKGVIVNKFVGYENSFNDGVKIIEEICKTNVVGVIPKININLEDEDILIEGNENLKNKNEFEGKDDKKYFEFLENEFNNLSIHFKKYLDTEKIYEIIKEQ